MRFLAAAEPPAGTISALAPLLAAAIALVFAVSVYTRYVHRAQTHQLLWASAFAMFGVAAAIEAYGAAAGWTPLAYQVYYLLGGVLTVFWLGSGSLCLAAPRARAWITGAVMLFSIISISALAGSSVHQELLASASPGRGAITGPVVVMAVIGNIAGSVVLIGTAAHSAWLAFRQGAAWNRVLGMAGLAAGAFVVAAGHSLAQITGVQAAQGLTEAVGIAVMFAGYALVEAAISRDVPLARGST